VRRQQVQLISKLRQEGKVERLVPPAAPAPAAPPAEQKKN